MPRALRFCPLPRAGFGESLAGWVAEGDGCVPPRAPRGPVDPSGDGAPQAFGEQSEVCAMQHLDTWSSGAFCTEIVLNGLGGSGRRRQ